MAQRVLELLSALSDKERLLEEMLAVLEEERRCIMERDLQGLDLQTEKKIDLFGRLEGAGEHSRELVREMAHELELPEGATLSPILGRLDEPERDALTAVQRAILERGTQLQQTLSANAELLQGALQTVTRSLDFFGRLFHNTNTYGKAGKFVGGGSSPMIICREA